MRGPPVVDNLRWAICERMAEVQALSEPELLRPMFSVGYFPPNTPPVSEPARQLCPSNEPAAENGNKI
jgi:hypothetical protein